MARMTVAEFVARTLAREGVGFVAGIPGSGLMEMLDVIEREGAIRLIQVRHEQVAALMAVGYGRATGRPAVCVGTRSPGGTNLVMGVTAAHLESVPLIVITGQVPSTLQGKGAFEEVDLAAIFRPITKWSGQLTRPDRIPDLLHDAFRSACSGHPGPVHLTIPYDLAVDEIDAEVPSPGAYRTVDPPGPAPEALARAVALLRGAQRPVMIAGGGVLAAGASAAAERVAERFQMPMVGTYQKKPVTETHALAMGAMGYGGSAAASFALRQADVILAVGTRLWDRDTDGFAMRLSADTRLIHVDIDPAVIGRNYPVACAVVADARRALDAIERDAPDGGGGNGAWAATCRAARASWDRRLASLDPDQRPVGPWRVVQELRRLLGPEDCLVTDSGSYIHYAARYFTALRPGTYFCPYSGSMGFGLPGAMGVQLARPQVRVAVLAGDGGFLMTAQDLETAVRERLPVVCVVLNNGMFGSIGTRQRAQYEGRLVLSRLTNPNFVAFAEAFGAWARRVETPEELRPALAEALASRRPAVIDVVSDDSRVDSPLLERWWTSGADAAADPPARAGVERAPGRRGGGGPSA